MTAEEKLKEIKKEIEELIEIEECKAKYHGTVSKSLRSEYFYRGRVAYMRHLLNVINR